MILKVFTPYQPDQTVLSELTKRSPQVISPVQAPANNAPASKRYNPFLSFFLGTIVTGMELIAQAEFTYKRWQKQSK
jgi:hypothetical protein